MVSSRRLVRRLCGAAMSDAIRRRVRGDFLRHSIIRRSVAVSGAFILGHLLNYALMFEANRILGPGGFGLFYTAVMVINVTMSPMVALTFTLARGLTDLGLQLGHGAAARITWRLVQKGLLWGVPGAAALGALLAAASARLGVEAWPIAVLVPATVLALLGTEMLRASFQSMLLFRWSSALWLVSQSAQFLLAVGGLFLFGKVWAGILGLLLGAAFAVAAYAPWFCREGRRGGPGLEKTLSLRLGENLPAVASYSLFVVMSNMDIVAGYLLLPRALLDVYAASALLPKAIVTATFPVAQIVLSVIIEQRHGGLSIRASLLKAVAISIGMSAIAAAALWGLVPFLQNTPFAIRGLDIEMMRILSVGSIGIGALRILVIAEIAFHRYFVGIGQAGAVAIFMLICAGDRLDALRIAEVYASVGWGFLLLAAAKVIFDARIGRLRAALANRSR